MTSAIKTSYIQAFTTPWNYWPCQSFPANLFKGLTQQRLQEARNAWLLFESVESADAALRLSYGLMRKGTDAVCSPTIWTPLVDQAILKQYQYGQTLHANVCPEIDWTSQRKLPPSPGPYTLNLTVTAPSPVTNITLTPSNQTIVVAWSNSTLIKHFTVVSNPDNLVVVVDGSRLSATMSGLTNNVLYTFSITATDYSGLTSAPAVSGTIAPNV
jgi:hypothetical protein